MTDRKKPGIVFWATVVVVVLLAGYVLSIGPAARLAQEGCFSEPMLTAFYAPLDVVVNACPEWVGNVFMSYFVLWGVKIDI